MKRIFFILGKMLVLERKIVLRFEKKVTFLLNMFLNFCFFFTVYTGLISPGVSVPVQVPGGAAQDMSAHHMGSMTSQYWTRIQ